MQTIENNILCHLIHQPYDYRILPDNFPSEVFTDVVTKELFIALTDLHRRKMSIEPLVIYEWASLYGRLNKPADFYAAHISNMAYDKTISGVFSNYVKIILSKYIKNRISDLALDLVSGKKFEESDVETVLENTIYQHLKLKKLLQMEKSITNHDSQLYFKVMKQIGSSEHAKRFSGRISTGFKSLDYYLGGWQPGELIVIGGRPGMGKTAFMLSSVNYLLKHTQLPVAYLSVENDPVQIMMRMITNASGVHINKLAMGDVSDNEMIHIHEASEFLGHSNFFPQQLAACTLEEVLETSERLIRDKGLKLLMIDYLQLLRVETKHFKTRDAEIGYITRSLKIFAREQQIPIVVSSQLSREVERRSAISRKPILSDLRDSGSIEQDAGQIILIYRPAYYGVVEDEEGNSVNNLANIVLAKNNYGICTDFKLNFVPQFHRFTDWEDDKNDFLNLRKDDFDDKFPF